MGVLPFSVTEIEYDNSAGRAFGQQRDGVFSMFGFDLNTGIQIGSVVPNSRAFNGLENVGPTLWMETVPWQN